MALDKKWWHTPFKWLSRTWYFITMNWEALYEEDEDINDIDGDGDVDESVIQLLEEHKNRIIHPAGIEIFYKANKFKWRQDPKEEITGITLEVARKPWVTFKLKEGDCEDFMLLNEYFMNGLTETKRYAVCDNASPANYHAILVFPWNNGWGLLSNYNFTWHETEEDAVRYYYKTKHAGHIEI